MPTGFAIGGGRRRIPGAALGWRALRWSLRGTQWGALWLAIFIAMPTIVGASVGQAIRRVCTQRRKLILLQKRTHLQQRSATCQIFLHRFREHFLEFRLTSVTSLMSSCLPGVCLRWQRHPKQIQTVAEERAEEPELAPGELAAALIHLVQCSGLPTQSSTCTGASTLSVGVQPLGLLCVGQP